MECNCKECKLVDECYRFLHATVRITNKCTQKCSHCCFESSPESNIMMSVDMAEKIAAFVKNNGVRHLNLMGGEFFCNKDWFEIFDKLISSTKFARIVTNGDWVNSEPTKEKLKKLVEKYGNKIHFSISKDKWHTNKNVDAAESFFKSIGAKCNVATPEETKEESIVPVGRGQFHFGLYSMFGCYCHKPIEMYSFLIDEEGDIYKCGMGVLQYANINDYIDGGFRSRFKEFNKKFYKVFISNCHRCYEFCVMQNNVERKLLVKK